MKETNKKTSAPAENRSAGKTASSLKRHQKYTPVYLRPTEKPKSKKKLWLLLIPTFAAICAVVIVLLLSVPGASYQIQEDAYQYYGGAVARISKGAQLTLDEDNKTILENNGRKDETSLPIYLGERRAIVTPVDMIYYSARDGEYTLLPCFSEVTRKDNGMIIVSRDGKQVQTDQGFLYDGKDFYLFLEPMVLNFNGYELQVPAYSYAEVVYGGYIMVFDFETKETVMEFSDGTGTAQSLSGDYTISLIGDSMTLSDGTKFLLFTRPDILDPII